MLPSSDGLAHHYVDKISFFIFPPQVPASPGSPSRGARRRSTLEFEAVAHVDVLIGLRGEGEAQHGRHAILGPRRISSNRQGDSLPLHCKCPLDLLDAAVQESYEDGICLLTPELLQGRALSHDAEPLCATVLTKASMMGGITDSAGRGVILVF